MRRPDILAKFLTPPAAGASKGQRLRFVRRCALFALAPVPVLWIDALVFGYWPTWLLILAGVGTGLSLLNLLSLSMRGRREREDCRAGRFAVVSTGEERIVEGFEPARQLAHALAEERLATS